LYIEKIVIFETLIKPNSLNFKINAHMKKFLHLLIFLPLFWASCVPQRIAILQPDIPTQYLDREGFATQKSDSLDVTFGYLFSTQDHLVFEVAVKNKSNVPVLVQPQDFAFQTVSAYDSTLISAPIEANSLHQITQIWDKRRRDRNVKAALIALAVVTTVVVIENQTSSGGRYNDYSTSLNLGVDLSYNFFDAMIYNHLSKKEAKRGLEKSLMFPKTIGPNESHVGAVYFPRNDDARQLLFNFKVAGQDFKTLFRQSIKLKNR
jgi:hypothetical protein